MSGEYVKVTVRIIMMTRDAVMITEGGDNHWLPQSLIHGGDLLKLQKVMRGDVVTFRLMAWKASELNL